MKKKTTNNNHSPGERCQTGVEGFDTILGGGLTRGCLYLIQGDPGSGKTTLALQFLLEGVRQGEKVFYVTLSESKEELYKVARSHGWPLDKIPLMELSAIDSLLRPEAHTTVFHSSEVELTHVTKLLLDETLRLQPARVVFDSLSELRLMAESPLRYRRQLLNLKQEFAKLGSTVLLIDDKMDGSKLGSDPHVMSLTHGVLEMEQFSPDYGTSRRRLRVVKMRGIQFREGFHDYQITKGGLRIFPRLVAGEHHAKFTRTRVSSGIKELDALFGGGLDRGTTTLIVGHAGTGKSTLALQYTVEMAKHGDRGLVFAFDETRGVLLTRAKALGLNVARHIESGRVIIQQIDPAEISPGEFAGRIRAEVQDGCKVVVIDSLNGYLNAMPGEKYLYNQLHELCSYLNQQGVITLLVLAQQGLAAATETPVELSYLADTVAVLRFFEAAGAVKQAVAVLKKRTGYHEKTIREFKLESGKGIRVGAPLTEFQGVLAGVPVFHGNREQMIKPTHAQK